MKIQGPSLLRHNRSLVARLVRGAAIWAVPLLAVIAIALIWFYKTSTYKLFDDPLRSEITSLIAASETRPDGAGAGKLTLTREPLNPRYQQALSGRYWLIGRLSTDGKIERIVASRSLYETTLELPKNVARYLLKNPGDEVRAYADGPDNNEPLRLVARSVILPNMQNAPVVMVVAADSRPADAAIRRFAFFAVALMILLTCGLVLAVFAQVRLGLRPLFELQAQVANVREGRSVSVLGDYPTEIQPLATELNSLISHNKDVVERARTHVANLAHALKTPLAVLINESQVSDVTSSEIVKRQSGLMKHQVDHHLQRARAAARGQMIGASTLVNPILEAMERTLLRIYGEKDIDFDAVCEEGLFFRGEKSDLDDLLGNLLDNACKWTQDSVKVRASIMEEDPTKMILSVEDNGPGLSDDEYAQAIKRGIRLDETTPGTGFGLAIVSDLAKAYQGQLVLSKSSMGGLRAVLTLPARI